MWRIDLHGDGRRVLVPIQVMRPEPTDLTSVAAVALLDTGATTSGISREVAEELGLLGVGKRPMGSAHGLALTERYIFRIGLDVKSQADRPAFPFVFPAALGFEIVRGSSFDALLGMDILRQCDLSLMRGTAGTLAFG